MKPLKEAQEKNEQELLVDAYLAEIGVCAEVFPAGTDLKRDDWVCDGWRVVFRNRSGLTECFDFFTGIGLRVDYGPGYKRLPAEIPNSLAFDDYKKTYVRPVPPCAASVLCSVIPDGLAASSLSFDDWCSDFGYDSDSIKALSMYRACCEDGKKLRRLFTDEQISRLSDILEDY